MKTPHDDLRRLIGVALLGLALFAAGLALAFRSLPEWRALPVPSPAPFVESYREITGGLGFQPIEGRGVHTDLVTQTMGIFLVCGERRPGDPAVAKSSGVCAEVRQQGELPGDDLSRELSVFYAMDGTPRAMAWLRNQLLSSSATQSPVAPRAQVDALARRLVAPGETLGSPRTALVRGTTALFYGLEGSAPAEHVRVLNIMGGNALLTREHGTAAEGIARNTAFDWMRTGQNVLRHLFIVGAVILFFLLLGKGRIDLINGALLAGILLLTMIPELFLHEASPANLIGFGLSIGLKVIWVFLVWSAGESFLRSYQPNFTTSLDSLRAGRLGPRGGRALLYGLALGIGLTGMRLVLIALAPLLLRAWPEAGSLSLPLASPWVSSVGQSFVLAGTVMLVMAAALRLLPARWAGLAAAVVIPLCWPLPLQLQDAWIEWALRALIAGMLVAALRRFGLTAMLTATVTFYLLPAAVYSSLSLAWMPWTFLGAGGVSVAILVLGLIGLRRPQSVEAHRLVPPAFMRRLEEDRRVRYEMSLLARMQEGLLPQSVPDLPGWQLAARSIVATEAGGDFYDFLSDGDGHLWIAAGDVAGHGYSCAIVQAMTTAALTSLIRPGLLPSEVLLDVDRVIRRGGSPRNFTSLALLRLDPRTGEVVLSNAGHPFPLLIADGEVSEIVVPGLPLGKGPKRRYRDHTLHLSPGASLVLCSDGLTETLNFEETPYFERPQEVLRGATTMPADEILKALLEDWRRHLGTEEPPDDTTIVVVRRAK